MSDYSKGKIYTLRSHQTDAVYIGSTIEPLYKRLNGHKRDFARYQSGKRNFVTSFHLFKYDDVFVELLENYPCTSREELHKKEGEHIRKESKCVNKYVPGRSGLEYRKDNPEKCKETRRRWKQENKEYYREQQKNYRTENVAKIKQHYQDNKEMIIAKAMEYERKNYEKIQTRRTEPIVCPCGAIIKRHCSSSHKRTLKHQALMETKEKQD